MAKSQTSITLSRDALTLRRMLARKLGLSQSSVIELGIRRLAELEGVKLPRRPKPKRKPTKATGSP